MNTTTNTTTGARYLKDLPTEELIDIISNNNDLRNITIDWLYDSGNIWLGNFLKPFENIRGLDYELGDGYGRSNYIKCPVSGYRAFCAAFIEAASMYCGTEEYINLAKRLEARADFYYEVYNGWEAVKNENDFENWMESGIEKLYSYICDYARGCYDFSEEDIAEEFIEGVLFNNEDLMIDADGNIFEDYRRYYN